MPLLFCLGQHSALSAVVAGLREGERLFTCLDDLYVVCKPDRVGAVHDLLRVHLWDKCRISLHAKQDKGVEQKRHLSTRLRQTAVRGNGRLS